MFGLYLHIPFCRHKCPYCDFYSVEDDSGVQLAVYPDLLLRQMKQIAPDWQGPLRTLFFGGGTPSLLSSAAITQLLIAAERTFGFAPGIEISLEANPGTVTPGQLTELRRAGVNRLSLGLQATDDQELARLGRIHTHAESLAAVAAARSAGFDNLSLDLIYGRPGQSVAQLEAELDRLIALDPQHLSCYALTVEAETPYAGQQASGTLQLPEEELVAEQYQALHQRLTGAGFNHYEISNFARPGRECRHNLGYWQRRSYLGLGAGAHTFCAAAWGERSAVPPDLLGYQEALLVGRDPADHLECFDRSGAMAETLYLGLRTAAGVNDTAFRTRFGCGVAEAFPAAVARCGERIALIDGHWRFDLQGWLLYDHLISHFL